MLSRRNIRIKVMQMLYSQSRDKELTYDEMIESYNNRIEQSFDLYLFNLKYFLDVVSEAVQDEKRRHAKHLPTEEDKRFTAVLHKNDVVQSLALNQGLAKLFDEYKSSEGIDQDTTRKLYTEFSKKPEYKTYLSKSEHKTKDHKEILGVLYKTCTSNELFNEAMEDRFPCWVDDKSLVLGSIKKTIKALPVAAEFYETYRPSYETTKEFGEKLIHNVHSRDKELLEIIEPTLKNWDADRVAVIDMILLKMAITELMIFPTIPTKVTLNEFVEISKNYSTEKSKDFINGILDHLMKKLNKEGKITKEGRGLLD